MFVFDSSWLFRLESGRNVLSSKFVSIGLSCSGFACAGTSGVSFVPSQIYWVLQFSKNDILSKCSWRAILKQYYEMHNFLEFQFMAILNIYEIPFHAVVVFRPEQDFLFKSFSTYRVSHSKVWKVILLWWGYTFGFLLI